MQEVDQSGCDRVETVTCVQQRPVCHQLLKRSSPFTRLSLQTLQQKNCRCDSGTFRRCSQQSDLHNLLGQDTSKSAIPSAISPAGSLFSPKIFPAVSFKRYHLVPDCHWTSPPVIRVRPVPCSFPDEPLCVYCNVHSHPHSSSGVAVPPFTHLPVPSHPFPTFRVLCT